MKRVKKKSKSPKSTKAELEARRSLEILDARHRPNEELRREVTRARLSFMCDEDLALSLRISVARLHECYAYELTVGPAESRRKLISAMYGEAMCGKPAAVKQLAQMTEAPLHLELSLSRSTAEKLKYGAVRVQELSTEDDDDFNHAPKHLGKKEQAKRDAKEAAKGERWGSLDDEEDATLQ